MQIRRAIVVAVLFLTLVAVPACDGPADKISAAASEQGRSQAIADQAKAVLPNAQALADANAAALKAAQDALAAAKAAGEADAAKLAAMQAQVAKSQADAAEAKAKADEIAAIKLAAEKRAADAAAEIERLKKLESDAIAKAEAANAKGAGVAGSVLPFVPAPYGELAGLVIGAVGGIGAWINRQRRQKLQEIAEGIVTAVENAQTDAGLVNFDDPLTRAKMKAELGPDGHALVASVIRRIVADDAAKAA
jgi:hypothetical protein